MIEKEFVPYQESLELKELGFNETCFTYYIPNSKRIDTIFQNNFKLEDYNSKTNTIYKNGIISTPIFSQAFRWFREKYHLIGGIEYIGGATPNTTWWDIYVVGHFNTDTSKMTMKYQPYEEAELECLRKLIEIVKNKQQ